ncbi:class C sortase [Actinomyces sp. B33]|uniref:class C sortase n=1 Tax=Actinomyces sp. B33 TaxID=2942131 RepID=UPI0023422401|nr:class C sortase [Actinomyces sp. B33]MDC4232153.1 class C sortase [Actinomyces sp. B33]
MNERSHWDPRSPARAEGANRIRRRWHPDAMGVLASVLALAALLVFTYPRAASWFSDYYQSQVVVSYGEAVASVTPSADEQRAEARAYNEALSSGAVLERNASVPVGDGRGVGPEFDYGSMLNADGAGLMARVRIPAIDLDLPVYHGTDEATLLSGLGHLQGTSLPVGGPSTRTVITGHRGLASATMFTRLDEVGVGDLFVIEVFDEALTYRVVDTAVIEPEETESLRAQAGRDLATLVTCTPLGINSHRILVTGERVLPTPVAQAARLGERPEGPGFPWWGVILVIGLCGIGAYLYRSGRTPREQCEKARGRAEEEWSNSV